MHVCCSLAFLRSKVYLFFFGELQLKSVRVNLMMCSFLCLWVLLFNNNWTKQWRREIRWNAINLCQILSCMAMKSTNKRLKLQSVLHSPNLCYCWLLLAAVAVIFVFLVSSPEIVWISFIFVEWFWDANEMYTDFLDRDYHWIKFICWKYK